MPFSFTVLFLLSATIFFLFGWLGLFPIQKYNKDQKWLTKNGTPVVANIDQIRKDSKSKRSYWTLLASWVNPEDGKLYKFQSTPMHFDPSLFLESGMISVLIDPRDPRRHYIDVEELRIRAGH